MIDNNPQSSIPAPNPQPLMNQSKPSILPFVVALLIVALVSGGGVYVWKQSEIKKLKTDDRKISVDVPTDEVSPTNVIPTPTTGQIEISSSPAPDTRTLLTTKNAYDENTVKMGGMAGKACDENFNHDSPTTFIIYKNVVSGLELSVPFNNKWGSDRYKVNPYDMNDNGISFGPFGIYEGCSWIREYSLSFVKQQDKESTKKTIMADSNTVPNSVKEFSPKGLTAFMWAEDGPGCLTGIEFVGLKSNYKIIFNGFCDKTKDQATLESLASWIKLI